MHVFPESFNGKGNAGSSRIWNRFADFILDSDNRDAKDAII